MTPHVRALSSRLPVLLVLLAAPLPASEKIQTKTTYAKAYGESKGNPTIDPAKDLPRYPAVEPARAVATWKVKKGFRLELAAHEPQLRSPIAATFDERGRMFVCEMIDYSEMRDASPHLGRVSMLEDRDGDGRYETSTVFADNLAWPTGLIWANGGLYVIATPDILFLKDTRNTGRADVREVVFTGLGTGLKLLNVQGLANCPQWGLDNRIHIQCGGGNRGRIKCLKRPDLKEIELGGRDLWFDPRTHEFGLEAGGAQYGMSFDNYGRKFACSNSDHLQFFVYDDRYAGRNPFFDLPPPRQSIAADGGAAEVFRISPDEPWRIVRTRWRVAGVVRGAVEGGGRVSGYFTGATGTTVYRGDAYGPGFVNNTFTGDAGGQLVHRKIIVPNGASLTGRRPADEQNFEFAASTDTWVRVVNFANAPDGCLHIIDMYREVIEHPWSIPDEIKKHLDLNSGNDRGRIYRVLPADPKWKRRAATDLAGAGTEELVRTLAHANGWHRDTAQRLLYERQDKSAVPLLEKLFEDQGGDDGRKPSAPLARIHALGALDGLGALSEAIVVRALSDSDPFVIERAMALSERFLNGKAPSESLARALARAAIHPSQRLRLQAAFTLPLALPFAAEAPPAARNDGKTAPANLGEAFLALALQESGERWISSAILGASPEAAAFILPRVLPRGEDPKAPADFVARTIAAAAAAHSAPRKWWPGASRISLPDLIALVAQNPKAANLRALGEGLRRAGTSLSKADTDNQLGAVFARAAATLRDDGASPAARIEAINLVSLDSPQQATPALVACLGESQPEAVQAAAVTALAQFPGNQVADTLLGRWPALKQRARAAALGAAVARPERALLLLQAVSAKRIPATDLSASDVQALLKHKDPAVAELADKALAEFKPPSRDSVIAKFRPALSMPGDAARGQVVFSQRCMACHRANGVGVDVAPPLLTVKSKGREGILVAILDPNKEVAPQFIAYTVNTKDGQTLGGIITNDTAAGMTLKLMGGAELNIPRSNIKGSSAAGLSLMPEGIEAGMTIQEMADLLDFIEALK